MVKRRGIEDDEALLEAELQAEESQASDAAVAAQVLVIDDNALNRTSIVRLLKSAGFTVISTDSAIGATRLVLRSGASVVVADLNMPAMQGSSLLKVFRRNPRLADIAVVLLSGVAADELVSAASDVGADAAVSKLEMSTTLIPVVQRLLRRAARPAPQASGRISLPASILAETAAKRRTQAG